MVKFTLHCFAIENPEVLHASTKMYKLTHIGPSPHTKHVPCTDECGTYNAHVYTVNTYVALTLFATLFRYWDGDGLFCSGRRTQATHFIIALLLPKSTTGNVILPRPEL